MQQEIILDLGVLINQLERLQTDFNNGIVGGKTFVEVKQIHLQIKELTKLINALQDKHGDRNMTAASN